MERVTAPRAATSTGPARPLLLLRFRLHRLRVCDVARDPDGRGCQRGGQDQTDHAEQAPGGDRDDKHSQWVEAERGTERDRLDELLEDAVREQRQNPDRDRFLRPARAEGDQNCERAGDPCPKERNVRPDECDDGDRAGHRHPEYQRSEPDDRPIEDCDDGHTAEVTPHRRQDPLRYRVREFLWDAEMALGPAPDFGPVLQQEDEAEQGERQEHDHRAQGLQALDDPPDERVECRARSTAG